MKGAGKSSASIQYTHCKPFYQGCIPSGFGASGTTLSESCLDPKVSGTHAQRSTFFSMTVWASLKHASFWVGMNALRGENVGLLFGQHRVGPVFKCSNPLQTIPFGRRRNIKLVGDCPLQIALTCPKPFDLWSFRFGSQSYGPQKVKFLFLDPLGQ